MKAVIIKNHGGPENLVIEEVPEPVPKDNEVIVKIHSAALNHLDIWVRKGAGGRKIDLPHVPGSDGAGTIIEKGSKTLGVKIDDKVIIYPGLSCGICSQCVQGFHSQCVSFGIIGMSCNGTFAEKVAVPFENVFPKPDHLDFNEAAALTLTTLTAWRMLFSRAWLKPGDIVLIHGIGGGVATSCLQLAKLAGAAAIVTSSSDEKIEKAKKIGADFGINYKKESDISEIILQITNGKGVDIIADSVGAATWPVNFKVAAKGARIVLCGVTTGAEAQTNLQNLYWNQMNIFGSTLGSRSELKDMLKAVYTSKLKPLIDSVETFKNIVTATEKMERAEQFGKIVIAL
ncbi:MAG: Alcohol dehydrogenase [Planctomycetes bacterium ADurb.Bin401]|nr:MAG: Alcohol dehydrogenase [Planctomycetes bacterium ADurb.Bin401]